MTTFHDEHENALDSKYFFKTGLGAPTSIQSPNQLGETSSRINEGIKNIEVGALSQNILDQIPETHFHEIRRLNKITGAEASFHAPIQDLDISGFVPGQNVWSEDTQKENILKIEGFIDKAHTLGRSEQDIKEGKGQINVPIVLHGGTLPAQKYQREGLAKEGVYDDEGLEKARIRDERSEMLIVNQDTGQIQGVKYEERKMLDGTTDVWTPEKRLRNRNITEWDQQKLEIMQMQKSLNEVQDRFRTNEDEFNTLIYGKNHKALTPEQEQKLGMLSQENERVQEFEREINQNMGSIALDMHNRFLKYGDEKDKKEYMEHVNPLIEKLKQEELESKKAREKVIKLQNEIHKLGDKKAPEHLQKQFESEYQKLEMLDQEHRTNILQLTSKMPAPKTWAPIEEFSKVKSAETVSEAAMYGYEKYGDKAPILAIENVYPGMQASRAKSLRETIEKSREEFAKKLMEKKKVPEKRAKEVAAKLIGATWDVGHINQLRKWGYSEEDIVEETKKIASLVKHVHLTDNFGFDDSHLPPGLGNVPIKAMLETLEKEGKFKGKGIVEAGAFVAAFKESPFPYTLEYFNSPLYTENAQPYWRDVLGTEGGYSAGFGEIMPQKYFDLYGPPGFSQLPSEMGGSSKRQSDRFSGTPME